MSKMGKRLGQIANGLKSYVKSAGARFALRTLHVSEPAMRVVTVRQLDVSRESPSVFDLTVENHHCYLANGLLVSNSNGADSFLILAVGMKRVSGLEGGVFGMSDGDLMDADEGLPQMAAWEPDGEVF